MKLSIQHDRSQSLLDYAILFALEAHGSQVRKYTGEPYVHHPVAVAKIVQSVSQDCEVLSAAILHDVIEDTSNTYEDIKEAFGLHIADYVLEVSDVSKPEDGNRKIRKEIDRQHLSEASPGGMTIKLADCLHNGYDIWEHDKNFAVVYMREIERLLPLLNKGHVDLYNKVERMIIDYRLSTIKGE